MALTSRLPSVENSEPSASLPGAAMDIVMCDREAVNVMCDREAVNATCDREAVNATCDREAVNATCDPDHAGVNCIENVDLTPAIEGMPASQTTTEEKDCRAS